MIYDNEAQKRLSAASGLRLPDCFRPRPHRRCGTARPYLGEHWSSKLMTRVRFPSPAPSLKSKTCLEILRELNALKSARGNVRGNKRPDFELHRREQDYDPIWGANVRN